MMRKGLVQPLLMTFFLAGGFLIVWFAAATFAMTLAMSAMEPTKSYELLTFLHDGRVVLQTIVDRSQQDYRDLEGNPVDASVVAKETAYGSPLAAQANGAAPLPPWSWTDAIRPFSDGGRPAVFWYFISDGGREPRGYFVGYDSASNRRVGYLGLGGFRPEPLTAQEYIPFVGEVDREGRLASLQRFSGNQPILYPSGGEAGQAAPGSITPWDVYLLGGDSRLYHADLRQRTLEAVVSDPQLRSLGLTGNYYQAMTDREPTRLLARSEEAVLILDRKGQVLRRYPLPEALQGQGFSFLETSKDEGLMYKMDYPRGLARGRAPVRYHIWWVRPDGGMRQAEGQLVSPQGEVESSWLFGALCPAPLVFAIMAGTFGPAIQMDGNEASSYVEGLGQSVRFFYPGLLFTLVVGAALAVVCYRRQVLYGASRTERVVWPLFVLALGLPGWLAYRFGCSWPRLERCPQCQAAVPRDREHCARCAAAFPRPALEGTEVFA